MPRWIESVQIIGLTNGNWVIWVRDQDRFKVLNSTRASVKQTWTNIILTTANMLEMEIHTQNTRHFKSSRHFDIQHFPPRKTRQLLSLPFFSLRQQSSYRHAYLNIFASSPPSLPSMKHLKIASPENFRALTTLNLCVNDSSWEKWVEASHSSHSQMMGVENVCAELMTSSWKANEEKLNEIMLLLLVLLIPLGTNIGARHPHDENSPTLYRAISSFIHKQQRHDVVTLRLSGDRKAFSVSRFLDLASFVFVHTSYRADEGGSQHESSDRVNSLAWCDAEWEIHHRFSTM